MSQDESKIQGGATLRTTGLSGGGRFRNRESDVLSNLEIFKMELSGTTHLGSGAHHIVHGYNNLGCVVTHPVST